MPLSVFRCWLVLSCQEMINEHEDIDNIQHGTC